MPRAPAPLTQPADRLRKKKKKIEVTLKSGAVNYLAQGVAAKRSDCSLVKRD